MLFCFGTILFSAVYNQHQAKGPNLLRDPDFRSGFTDWQASLHASVSIRSVSGHGGILAIASVPPGVKQSVSVMQVIDIPRGHHLLTLSCEARALNVVPGEKRWEKARVALFPLTTEGKPRYDTPHTLAALEGTTPWARFEQVFRVPEESTAVSAVVQILNASGTLVVRSISLRSAIENPSYSKWRHALMSAWLIAGLWIVWPLLRVVRSGAGRTWVLATGSAILIGVLMPVSVKYSMIPSWLLPESEAPGFFRDGLLPVTAPFRFELLPTELDIYKLAHFLLFAIVGYLLVALRPYRTPIWMQAGIVTLFALATESMQVLAPGRGGSVGDVLIDTCGTCCGMFIAAVMRHHYNQKPNSS